MNALPNREELRASMSAKTAALREQADPLNGGLRAPEPEAEPEPEPEGSRVRPTISPEHSGAGLGADPDRDGLLPNGRRPERHVRPEHVLAAEQQNLLADQINRIRAQMPPRA